MVDRLFGWFDSNPLGKTDIDGEAGVVILVDTAPTLTEGSVDDIAGELDRDDVVMLASAGTPWAVSVATGPTLDGAGTAVGYILATDGASDTLRQPIVYIELDTPTGDPVAVSTGALLTVLGNGVATALPYEADEPSDWTEGEPSNVGAALDTLAARAGGGVDWESQTGTGNIVTRKLGDYVKILYTGGAVPVVDSGPAPVMLGTVASGHEPPSPAQGIAWWIGSGTDIGELLVIVDDGTGTALGTPRGVWVMDATGTLTDTDDRTPSVNSIDWWLA